MSRVDLALMLVKLGLVVIEDEQRAGEVDLVNHPPEITVPVSALERALDYLDRHTAPLWLLRNRNPISFVTAPDATPRGS